MRIAIVSAVAATMLALAACNSPTVPPGNYGTVTGTVSSSSGQPVAGVIVQADYGPQSPPTGPDGRYSITNAVPISSANSPTTISVSQVPAGYGKPPPQNVQVVAGQTTQNVNFILPPG